MDRFQAKDNVELMRYLKDKGVIKSQRTFETMCKVDRKNYVKQNNVSHNPYIDGPQSLGHGRTISAPHMHGIVLEKLENKLVPGKKALCIRCNAGYLTTCMALMLGPTGSVISVESIPELYKQMKENIATGFSDLLISNRIQLILGYERSGYLLRAPYDIIYVGAAAEEVPEALANGGSLIMPIGSKDGDQTLTQIDKFLDGKIIKTSISKVRYQYLTDANILTCTLTNKAANNENLIAKRVNTEDKLQCELTQNVEWKVAYDHINQMMQKMEKKLDNFLSGQKFATFGDISHKVDELEQKLQVLETNLKEEMANQSAIMIKNLNNILCLKIEDLSNELVNKCTSSMELENKLNCMERNLEKEIKQCNASVEKEINNTINKQSDHWDDLNDKITLIADRIKDLEDTFNQKLIEEYVKSFKSTSKHMEQSLHLQNTTNNQYSPYESVMQKFEKKREERDYVFLIIVVLHFFIIFVVLFFK